MISKIRLMVFSSDKRCIWKEAKKKEGDSQARGRVEFAESAAQASEKGL